MRVVVAVADVFGRLLDGAGDDGGDEEEAERRADDRLDDVRVKRDGRGGEDILMLRMRRKARARP